MADEAYIRWVEDGNIEGPFEDAAAAEDWALDQGGPDEFKIIYEEEIAEDVLKALRAKDLASIVTVTIRAQGLREDETIRALEKALAAYNGEAFRQGTLKIIA